MKNFPEVTGNKKVEKQEALLTVITAWNLTLQEQERLEDADVTVTRPEKRRKERIDLKICMDQADGLMRKIWSQLEKPCREEGMKRTQGVQEGSVYVQAPKGNDKNSEEKAQAGEPRQARGLDLPRKM